VAEPVCGAFLPDEGYIFREHTIGGPSDKIFEEAAFLERFRKYVGYGRRRSLWLARATPRAWWSREERFWCKNAPTHFGTVGYQIVSERTTADHGNGGDALAQAPQERAAASSTSKVVADQECHGERQFWTNFDPVKK